MEKEILDVLVANLEKQTAILENMTHQKSPAHQGTNTPLHGTGGIFSTPGLERDVITAHVKPEGISSVLPVVPSVNEDPRFGTLTGFTAASGNEAVNVCDDAPAGYMKGCNLTARFGLVRRDTQTIDLLEVMRRTNRGDMSDLVLRGRILSGSNLAPSMPMNEGEILNIVVLSEMLNAGVQVERVLSRQIWQGVSTVQNEFVGLDSLIATGHKDADTGVTCTALNSDVKNFNYDLIGGNGRDIVEYLSMLEFYLRSNAENMGLMPAEWVVVMRPELWFELSAVWPCSYLSNKCSSTQGITVLGSEQVSMRDAMRNQKYIDINGNRYQVVTDTGIFEHNNVNNNKLLPGQYASSIYFVPLTIVGGLPVTYREYLDYRAASTDISIINRNGGSVDFWTDNGIYSWAYTQEKWCMKLHLRTEQRVILRTPQLAGRIDAIKYSPLQHIREPYPDSPYFFDGGVSVR